MGFVKPKKIWRKKFSQKEIEEIWDVFIDASPLSKEEWEKISLTKFMKKNTQIVHPETDKFDDTEGVQPGQMKRFLDVYSLEDFKKMISFLNDMAAQPDSFLSRYVSDGYISWETVFADLIEPRYQKEESIEFLIGSLYTRFFSPDLQNFRIDKDLLIRIGSDFTFAQQVIEAIKVKKLKNSITLADIDLKAFLKEREIVWKNVKNIVPRSRFMLMTNPNNFDTKVLPKIEHLFGSKQIAKLKEEDQQKVSIMLNLFGINILSIEDEKLKQINSLANLNNYYINVKDFRPVIDKIKEIGDISLNRYYTYVSTFVKYPTFYEDLRKKDLISKEDLELILYIQSILNYARTEQQKENLLTLEPYYWKVFKRYGVHDAYHILSLVELFQANKENKCSIPNIEGKSGSYTYELIKKDNPIGLILGYATDCCQVIGNNGHSCLQRGYDKENSTFFVIKKKDRIYAQSWVWEKTTKDGLKVLCFDSIEVLGKDLNKSKDIMAAYIEVSKQLVEDHEYDMVIAGADGNSIPNGLKSMGKYKEADYIHELDLVMPFRNTYTDANEEIIIIKEKQ